jgi:hypothetical protein
MHGHVIAHGKSLAGGVEECTGIVATLFDVGRKRGATKGGAHLFGDGMEEMLEDLELDGIGAHVGKSTPRRKNSDGLRTGSRESENHQTKRSARYFLKIFVDILKK